MTRIAESSVRRLSLYLRFLEAFERQGIETVSSAALAERGGTTSAQVRKDLSFFGSFGKRGLGYAVPALTQRLRDILGLERSYRVVLVGAGKMGSALAQYRGFTDRGFQVIAAYDIDPAVVGQTLGGVPVRHVDRMPTELARERADVAIIVTPAEAAQAVAGALVQGGIKAILNFTPVQLDVPDGVVVKNVNMALELETLSYALRNR